MSDQFSRDLSSLPPHCGGYLSPSDLSTSSFCPAAGKPEEPPRGARYPLCVLPWDFDDVRQRLQEFRDILRRSVTRSHITPMDDLVTFAMYVSWQDLRMDDLSLVRRLLQNIECLLFTKRPALLNHVYPHTSASNHPVPACRLVFQLLKRNSFPSQLFQLLLRDVYHLIVQLPAEGVRLLLGLRRQTGHVNNTDLNAYLNRRLGHLLLNGPWTRYKEPQPLAELPGTFHIFHDVGTAYAYAWGRHVVGANCLEPNHKIWTVLGSFLRKEVLTNFASNPVLVQNINFDLDFRLAGLLPEILPCEEVIARSLTLFHESQELRSVKCLVENQLRVRQKVLWENSLPPAFAQLYSFVLPYDHDRWSCTPSVPQAVLQHESWLLKSISTFPEYARSHASDPGEIPFKQWTLHESDEPPTPPPNTFPSPHRSSLNGENTHDSNRQFSPNSQSNKPTSRRASQSQALKLSACPDQGGSSRKDFALALTGTVTVERLDQMRNEEAVGEAVDSLYFALFLAPNVNVQLTPGTLDQKKNEVTSLWFPTDARVGPHALIFRVPSKDQYWLVEVDTLPSGLQTQYIKRPPLGKRKQPGIKRDGPDWNHDGEGLVMIDQLAQGTVPACQHHGNVGDAGNQYVVADANARGDEPGNGWVNDISRYVNLDEHADGAAGHPCISQPPLTTTPAGMESAGTTYSTQGDAVRGDMPSLQPTHLLSHEEFDWMAELPPLPPLPVMSFELNLSQETNMCAHFQFDSFDLK